MAPVARPAGMPGAGYDGKPSAGMTCARPAPGLAGKAIGLPHEDQIGSPASVGSRDSLRSVAHRSQRADDSGDGCSGHGARTRSTTSGCRPVWRDSGP